MGRLMENEPGRYAVGQPGSEVSSTPYALEMLHEMTKNMLCRLFLGINELALVLAGKYKAPPKHLKNHERNQRNLYFYKFCCFIFSTKARHIAIIIKVKI